MFDSKKSHGRSFENDERSFAFSQLRKQDFAKQIEQRMNLSSGKNKKKDPSLGYIDNQIRNMNFFRSINDWRHKDHDSFGVRQGESIPGSKLATPFRSKFTIDSHPSEPSTPLQSFFLPYKFNRSKDTAIKSEQPSILFNPTGFSSKDHSTMSSKLARTKSELSKKFKQMAMARSPVKQHVRSSSESNSRNSHDKFDSLFANLNSKSKLTSKPRVTGGFHAQTLVSEGRPELLKKQPQKELSGFLKVGFFKKQRFDSAKGTPNRTFLATKNNDGKERELRISHHYLLGLNSAKTYQPQTKSNLLGSSMHSKPRRIEFSSFNAFK